MIGVADILHERFRRLNMEVTTPAVQQTLSAKHLKELLPLHDGWIIGDDPASRDVLIAGRRGNLKAAVKWGVGTDNIDFAAFEELDIPVSNTPNTFGKEVADMALCYLIALSRDILGVDRGIRLGDWPKPRGISLAGKKVALIGYGDIGQNLAKRLLVMDMSIAIYDPSIQDTNGLPDGVYFFSWPKGLEDADFVVVTCSLNASTHHMLNDAAFASMKRGVRVINVSRGQVIEELALVKGLNSGLVHSAALDVYEVEPLPSSSSLLEYSNCIFGAHNASNTHEAVLRASELAIQKLASYLSKK